MCVFLGELLEGVDGGVPDVPHAGCEERSVWAGALAVLDAQIMSHASTLKHTLHLWVTLFLVVYHVCV